MPNGKLDKSPDEPGREISAEQESVPTRLIVRVGIDRLKIIARDSQLSPREGETEEGQAARLEAERSVVLGMLGRLGIVPDRRLLEGDESEEG